MSSTSSTTPASEASTTSAEPRRLSWSPESSARLVTAYAAFSGVLSIVMALAPVLFDQLLRLPDLVSSGVFALGWPSLGYGTLLLLMTRSLRRRKRAAWLVLAAVTGINLLTTVSLLIAYGGGQDWGIVVVLGVLAAATVHARSRFGIAGDPSNPRAALTVVLALLAVCVVLGTTLVAVQDQGRASLADHLTFTLSRALTSTELPLGVPGTVDVPTWVTSLVNATGTVLLVVAMYVLFRPRRSTIAMSGQDEQQLRELLATNGEQDSLSYFALRLDKTPVFSPNGKAAVLHRVVGGVTLASGDPVGHPSEWAGAIAQWRTQAREHAWTPGVLGASEAGASAYDKAGLDVLEIGDEAVVDVASFSLDGRPMRSLRQAVNRVARAGYTVAIDRQEDMAPAELERLADLVQAWRTGETERGFSMALGRLGDRADGQIVVLRCLDPDGEVCAVLTFVPWGRSGLSLDLMRRDSAVEVNGINEFMVVSLLERGPELGIARVSLNFAMFRSVFDRGSRLGAGFVLRLWHRLLVLSSRWWQLESLYRANMKYRPEWVPRYLCFERAADLPRLGVAAARAEGFITAPTLRRRA